MTGTPFHPSSKQDMARDNERPHLDVILDNQYLILRGTGPDVDPTTLSGHVRLFLTEATSIKGITLQFKGKAKIPVLSSDFTGNNNNAFSSHVVCNHDWSFLEGDKKHSHTLNAGRHLFPFRLEISGSLPSSLSTSTLGGASVAYRLHAVAARPGLSLNLQAETPVFILRSLTREALEYQQTLDIESTWPEKLMYAITLPHKAWAAGDTLTAIVKFSPLAKGIYVQAIDSSITETTKICAKGWNRENTRVVASVRHEIIDHKAVEVEMTSPNSSAVPPFSSSGTATAHSTHSPRTSRPASPRFGSSSSNHHSHHHPPPQHHEQQEEEDLSNDVVTYINLPLPRSSVYPFLYSSSDAISSVTTPPHSTFPTVQHALLPLSTNSAGSQPTSLPLSSVTPSHSLEPILISHRIKWIIFIHNKDGHLSELRCSLPIKVLDGALLGESRGFTLGARRLLLRTSGLGNVLSRDEGSDDEGGEGAGVDGEEGRVMEADRELPSYPAHVRDRVANMYLSDAVTMRVSNPWVGRVGPTSAANKNGARTSSTPELSGQRDSNPLIAAVSPSDPASADHSIPPIQPDSRASRSGHSTPAIQLSQQQVGTMSHLPHTPGQSSPLEWVNTELYLSLSLNNRALRRIGSEPPSVSGQQQQSQLHQQQHHSHSQNEPHPQQSRTLRWGSRVGSRAGSRAGSPERIALSSVTTNNNGNGPSSLPEVPSSVIPSSSSSGSGFASPFQHLFKATIKPFTALAGHHSHGHGPGPTPSRSLSTTSLMGLQSTPVAGITSGKGRPSALNSDPRCLSFTSPSSCADLISSSSSLSSPALRNETNSSITDSSSSQSLAENATFEINAPSSSSLSNSGSESLSTYPSHPISTSTSAPSLSHIAQPESQDPSSIISRAFSVVPDYSIASRGFIGGGVPPLSSMRGLPSYEEAEAQRREREMAQVLKDRDVEIQCQSQCQTSLRTQTQTQSQDQIVDEEEMTKMRIKGRGSMSEPDLVGRFGHACVRFESRTQVVAGSESGTSGVGITQQLQNVEDEDDGGDGDTGGTGAIQMHTKKARP